MFIFMKNFVFVKFKDGSSDAIYKSWMFGETQCHWPPENVRNLAKGKAEWKDNWKYYECTVLCESSKFNNAGVKYVNIRVLFKGTMSCLISNSIACIKS